MSLAATGMELEMIILSEASSERERQIPYDTTYMQNLKYDTNEHIYETETDSQNKFVVAKGEGWIGSLGLANTNYDVQDG